MRGSRSGGGGRGAPLRGSPRPGGGRHVPRARWPRECGSATLTVWGTLLTRWMGFLALVLLSGSIRFLL